VSCPDWRALAAERDRSPLDPPGWDEALAHLEGCAACRRDAVAADPTLAFRSLPPLALDDSAEVEAMRLRLAALRGAAAVTPARRHLPGVPLAWRRLGRRLPWRAAAAAAVTALAVLAGGNLPHGSSGAPALRAAVAPPSPAARTSAAAPPALAAELASEPVLDGIDKPFDHVVQWNGDDLSVILVVDQRLGV